MTPQTASLKIEHPNEQKLEIFVSGPMKDVRRTVRAIENLLIKHGKETDVQFGCYRWGNLQLRNGGSIEVSKNRRKKR